MEAFSLLNYWKTSGAVSSGFSFLPQQSSDSSCRFSGETTTVVTSVTETDDEADDDHGPFFDLEFALPVEEDESEENTNGREGDSDCTDGGCEFKFTLSSCSGGEDRIDPDLDDVYFKEQILEEEVEPPSSSCTGTEQTCSVKAPAAQLSASILKSATKLRVLMLGMKKSKLIHAKSEANFRSGDLDKQNHPHPPPESQPQQKTVNLKAEEVPIISLFTRENSSRNSSSSSSSSSSSTKKQNGNESVVSEEKRFVMMQKYLKKVKPLYIRVSRRYGEKLRESGQLNLGSSASSAATKTHKTGNINIPAGLNVVRKHLGKSRSSSSTTVMTTSESRRRDDSLMQQQDSIQSAILHCKRSFNSSRDKVPSVLPRSVSDTSSYDK